MPVSPDDEDADPTSDASISRTRQWRRAALALAILFASLPVAGRLFLGSWRFDDALGISFLCLIAAAYLYFVGREAPPPLPDSAAILDEALRLAASGQTGRALALLDEALRLNPGLWQAWQYRGQIHLAEPETIGTALKDLTESIQLAPAESHLYILRSHAFTLLGDESSARTDLETADSLRDD